MKLKPSKYFLLVPIFVIILLLIIIGIGHLIQPSWIGEQPSTAGYFQKTFGLITDTPHATAELFYSSIESIVLLFVGFNWGKYRWKQEHKKFDTEHDIEHN